MNSLLSGLVAYWSLNEQSGTRYSHNGLNDLTDNNTVTGNPGKVGMASQFTALNGEYLSCADNVDLSTGDTSFHVVAWVNFDSLTVDRGIVEKDTLSGVDAEYTLRHDLATSKLLWIVRQIGGADVARIGSDTFGTPTTSVWIFVSAFYDTDANIIGLSVNNGVIDTASTAGSPSDSTASFGIGRATVMASYMDGRINGVGFWKRRLSTSENSSLYNNGNGLAYPFDDQLRHIKRRRTRLGTGQQLNNMLQPV